MLEVKNVSKCFADKKVLDEVNFSVKKGQIVALLGENGAGKSTLLRILSGFIEPDSGAIKIDKLDLFNNRLDFLVQVGYVQEISALYGDMCVYEFLCFVANVRKVGSSQQKERIKEAVELLELGDVLLQRNDTLSKGFKKRVELASVLLAQPQILLLDEPTEGLDPNQKFSIRQTIKQYAKGHIVIVSTHTLEDVEALADRVLLLHKGKLMIDANLKEFKKTADNDLLASFRKVTLD